MILSEKTFIETINFIRDREEAERKLTKLMSDEFGDAIFWPYMKYEQQLVAVLEEIFKTDLGSWYIYEAQYGERFQSVFKTNKDESKKLITVKTPEQLYKFIIKDLEEKNK